MKMLLFVVVFAALAACSRIPEPSVKDKVVEILQVEVRKDHAAVVCHELERCLGVPLYAQSDGSCRGSLMAWGGSSVWFNYSEVDEALKECQLAKSAGKK